MEKPIEGKYYIAPGYHVPPKVKFAFLNDPFDTYEEAEEARIKYQKKDFDCWYGVFRYLLGKWWKLGVEPGFEDLVWYQVKDED